MKAAALLMASSLFACGASERISGSGDRYVNQEQAYSLELPDGWQATSVRGAIRLAPNGNSKHSITIRSAPRLDQIEGKILTNDVLAAETLRTLQALPRMHLVNKAPVEGTEIPGETFTLTFVPTGQRNMYRRTHVVLLGTKHIFHVIEVAPDGDSLDERSLKELVTTFKEEV
jgi:hypothetical protein